RLLELLHVDSADELDVVLVRLRALDQRVDDAVDVLGDRALLRSLRLRHLLLERQDRSEDLLGPGRNRLELARRQPAVVADRRVADELADLLRVLGRDLRDQLDEQAPDESARILERREHLLLGPVVEAADPEVVVLVEVPLLALREVLAAAGEPVLERGKGLVAVDVDLLGLGLDLVLEIVDVRGALLDVDRRDDRGGEVEHLLELARRDVEQVADARRHALEEPDVRDRSGKVDVAHALAADLLPRHLDAAALADDALVADALVLPAVALPVARRPEDALAEEAVPLGLQRAVVDGLRLGDLAHRPVPDLLRRSESDPDRVEVVDVDLSQSSSFSLVLDQSSISTSASSASPSGPTSASTSSSASSVGVNSTSSRSPSSSSAGRAISPSESTRSWPSSASSAVGGRAAARSEPGER